MFIMIVIRGYINGVILRLSSTVLIFRICEDYTEGYIDDYLEKYM